MARADIIERGYETKSIRMWPPSDRPDAVPTFDDWQTIASRCAIEQDRMLQWSNGCSPNWDPRSVYDGSMASLVRVYQGDPDSPYQDKRYRTRQHYDRELGYIVKAVGDARVPALTFRDFRRWYEMRSAPKLPGGPMRKGRGHAFITYVRIVIGFGALLKLKGCRDARDTLSEMEFENAKKRTIIITPAQVAAHIAKAHELGWHSIAFAQALQDGCIVRQKDIIGEWLPQSEPGISDVLARGEKWMHGFRWEEASSALVLTHRLSKSIRGKKNVTDLDAGKSKSYDLTARPLIMAEIARIPEEKRRGPMVVCEYTGLPWREKQFQSKWREIARAASIPDHVQNRDTRAGGITDGRKKGARLEDMRHGAGHSQISTTAGYDRDDLETDQVIAGVRWNRKTDDAS